MGKHEKLICGLNSRPKDFTFQELTILLAGFGYVLNSRKYLSPQQKPTGAGSPRGIGLLEQRCAKESSIPPSSGDTEAFLAAVPGTVLYRPFKEDRVMYDALHRILRHSPTNLAHLTLSHRRNK